MSKYGNVKADVTAFYDIENFLASTNIFFERIEIYTHAFIK